MFKLQVVLVPPSAQNALLGYGLASSTAESSQLMGVNPMTAPRNGETTLPYAPSGNNSIYPYQCATRLRKFLHFTKSANSLLDLSAEIDQKCAKMYPYIDELEILSLQDSQGCDLDPDFLVKDIFTMDNVVRVIIKNELEIDESSPVSSYRAIKRKKLNSGVAQSPPIAQGSQAPPSSSSSGVLNIAKKRPAAFAMRHSTNSNIRVSTPLAHQIYPPPTTYDRMVSNNSEDEDDDLGERSFLPPPAQPQSPPIRISSGMDTGKKIKSMVEEDTVSRSETVDPDKLKQQRLLSGTPVRPTMTPNRVTLTGQRVISEHQSSQPTNVSVFTAPISNRKNSFATSRVTSGRLSIPEPKIAEIEKELKEGPSSPSSMLPPKADRIPMKKPFQETEEQLSDEDDSSEEQETDKQVKTFIQRQTSSIADNNGSPTKNSPLSDDDHVRLAELPQTSPSSSAGSQQRKTSLEARVQHKLSGGYAEEEPLRIDNFSEEEEAGVQEKEHDIQWEIQLERTKTQERPIDNENDVDGNDTANETVVVRDSHHRKPSANNSIHKEELLRFLEGDDLPAWNKHSSKRKPYTTVLRKDIDNSKPDPRNILPERMTRNAAKRAAQILAGNAEQSSGSESEPNIENSSSGDVSSSGIESDASLGDEDSKIAITENNSVKTLNIHPLRETVIEGDESSPQAKEQLQSSKLDSEQSEGTSFGSSTDQEENHSLPRQQGQVVAQSQAPEQIPTVASLLNPLEAHSFPLGQRERSIIQVSRASTSPKAGALGQIKFQLPSIEEKEQPKAVSKTASSSRTYSRDNNQSQPAPSPSVLLKKEDTNTKRHDMEFVKGNKLDEDGRIQSGKDVETQTDKDSKEKSKGIVKRTKEEEIARRRQEREEKRRLRHEELERKKRLQQEREKSKEEEFKKQQEMLEKRKLKEFKRQQELEKKEVEFSERKRQEELNRQKREEDERKKEAEMMKSRLEELGRRKREEIEKKKQAELERMRREESARQKQEELTKRKQDALEKKRQEEFKRKEQQEELEKKRQEELERHKLAELEKKKEQEELQKNKQQEELQKKKQQEELQKKKQQEELQKKKQQEELQKKKQQEELQKKKQQEELQKKKQQEELQKKKQQEELQKKKQQEEQEKKQQQEEVQKKKQQEEQEKKKQQEELQKKKQQEEVQKKKQQEEVQKKKQQEEQEKKKQQEELQKKKQQEELQKKQQQEEVQKKKQQEEVQKKKQQEEQEKKKQQEELQKKKQQEELQKKRREEVQKKRQAEQEKKRGQEDQKRRQSELEKKKQEQAKKKSKAASVSKSDKPSAAINGSDKLKELKARFTSSKTYVPASLKGKQQSRRTSSNGDTESSEEESSTEYSSSSSEEDDEPSSKKSRRKVVDTPKGSVTTGSQRSSPKKLPAGDGVKFAPQSTQRSNLSSQLSQNEIPITRMMDRNSPTSTQTESSGNSSILGGLPKKVRPSLSSLSDLVSRGVPEVKEKSSSSHNAPKAASKRHNSNSDDKESEDIDDSETESESSNSDSDDSDSGDNSFISAKTASTALGKKKKGNRGFASLIRDSQKK